MKTLGVEIKSLIPVIAEYSGPVYLRISRAEVPEIFKENDKIETIKEPLLQEGEDITLVATGVAVYRIRSS